MIKHLNLTHRWDPNSLDQSGPGNNGNEGLLHIPQSSRTVVLPSDDLVSYSGNLLGSLTPLQRYSWGILQSQLSGLPQNGQSVVKVWILALLYKMILYFQEIFLGLKG